jgi:hypothetical protein
MVRSAEACLSVCLGVALALFAADSVWAEDLPPIELEVQVVHGSNEIVPARQDPACANIRSRLPMQFESLSMLKREKMRLQFGDSGSIKLPSGRSVQVTPISVVNNRLHVHLQMSDLVDTRLQMKSGVPMILGGVPHDRGQLIIMLTPDFGPYLQQGGPPTPKGPRLHRVNSR